MLVWFPLVAALGAALGSASATTAAPDGGEVSPCEVGQFACGGAGGRCLPGAWRCDGRPHCDAGEDEMDCQWNTTCGAGQFRCVRSGRCIAASWRCDGDEDCGPHDRSDEEPYMCERDVECEAGEARCLTPVGGHFPCVSVARYCDGVRDCLDGSDEWDICDNFTVGSCAPLGCSQVAGAGCRPTHRGLACYCPQGYYPAGDLCVDRDECAKRETCSQRCANVAGSYVCSCVEGYVLDAGDGRSCRAVNVPPDRPPSLLVVTQADIRRVITPTTQATPLTANNTLQALNVRAIDYLYDNRSICYVHHNMSKSGIVCVDADDFSVRRYLRAPTLFPDIDSVSHLALDWVSGNWYFGDDREVIYVCNSELEVCRIIMDAELSKVRGMAVDPLAGLMFLCVWGATPAGVVRATLAGTERGQLAGLKLVYPTALVLDLANREVYWTDSYLETVERARYDGSQRRTVYRSYLTQKLQHIALLEETLYLPVWAERAVLAVSTAGGPGARTELGARPVAALVFHRARQPAGAGACRGGGGCSHLCVPEGGGAGGRCLCPHGMRLAGAHRCVAARLDPYLVVARGTPPLVQALPVTAQHAGWEPAAPATGAARPSAIAVDQRGSRLYYCDVHRYEIVRQQLDGSGREVFIDEEVDNCEGIAVDWMGGNLYWTDSALGEVSVCRLDDAGSRTVVARHEPGPAGGSPRAIALDPAAGDMYWTVWPRVAVVGAPDEGGGGGRIETARMDGSRRRTLVPDGLRWPSGVALHAGALYWTDTFLDKIERLVLSSGEREVVTRASKPYGLAVYEGAVIWSEHATGEIRRLEPAPGSQPLTLHRLPPPLYDLKLVSSGDVTGGNACSADRGGCAQLCLATRGGRTCAAGGGGAAGPGTRARCPPGQFHCGRGQCVDALYVCDGDADCPDASDEDASPTGPCANMTCGAERYVQCDVTRCVPRGWLCDGLADCADGGDEAAGACGARACAPGQWACARSRRCVPAAWRCDGAADCGEGDRSDEEGCGEPRARDCAPDEFRCEGGSCVPWQYYCDGRADCADASDERGCGPPTDPEPPTTHTHANTIHGGGGGTGTMAVCLENEMQCNSSECVPKEARCNDVPDCLDGSDEAGCPPDGATTGAPVAPGTTPRAAAPCAPPSLACDAGARCVPLAAQCDARADCADGADEAGRCGEPMCAVSACSHGCAPTPAGPACTCPPALRLQHDGTTCAARHACSDWGTCSQRCVPHKHRVRCACDPGYLLADDGFTCKSTVGGTPLLVFSSRHEVRGVELGPGAGAGAGARALVSSLKNAVAVEWAAGTAPGAPPRLYWTDVVDETIYSGELAVGGAVSDVRPVLEGGLAAAEGLAVDWLARNLYWVESSLRRIEVARLEGRYRRTLVSGGGMEAPRALAADPAAALLFWSDWEAGAPRVERCSLAGGARRVVVRVDALAAGAWPNGVALDARARRLYWADARTDSIHTTTYEGEDHRVVLAGHEALAHPFALAVFESHIYWTDWRANAVVRANKWNGTEVTVVQRTLGQPFDLTVVHASQQPPPPPGTSNPCDDNGGCSHLCLLATNTSRTCACPHLMRLAPDARTCAPHERALLVARPGEVLCVDVESGEWACGGAGGAMCAEPRHLAVVGAGAVAWADGAAGEVRRVALAGGRVVALGEGGALAAGGGGLLYRAVGEWLVAGDARGERAAWLRGPLPGLAALAVDARRGHLYWARETTALGARLEAAHGDGTHLRLLRTDNDDPLLAGVTGLVVDGEANRLYWVNTGSNSIQYMEVSSGDTRTVALGAGARPTALELDGGRLLWADGADGTLRTCGVHPHVSCDAVLRRDTTAVLALRVYDARAAPPPGACVARDPPCAHLCLEAGGRAACRCAAGYTLAADGAACRPAGPLLAYSLGWELRALPLPGAGVEGDVLAPRLGSAQATALAYSPAGEWVYWADGEAGGVWRVRRDGTGRARVAHVPSVGGLALDHLAGTVYWGDAARHAVEAARPDGTARLALLDTSPASPSALAVDARRGYLFVRAAPWLQHARLDGSDRRLVREHDHISALALDTPASRVYWVEGWEGQVMSAPYPAPGGAPGEARAVAKLAHPVALAPHAGWLYWLDVGAAQGGLLAAPLDNLTAPATVLAGELGDGLLALSVWTTEDDPTTNTTNNNTCSPSTPCDGLCLYNGSHPRCVCPHGHLAPDLHTCTPYESFVLYSQVSEIDTLHLDTHDALNAPYPPIQDSELMRNAIAVAYSYEESTVFYSDITRGAIGAVRFDGTRHETLVGGVGAVEGMVYSRAERALYWTSGAGVVRAEVAALRAVPAGARAGLAAPAVQLAAGARPRGLDLDPCERRLYWADWGAAAGVRRAHAGRAPQTVVGTGVLMPNGLALDHAARWLYWADARLDRVERAHYDGSHRMVVAATGTDHPFGVAAAGGRVYWTEWVTRAVYTASSTGGDLRRLATTQHRPMAIVAVLPDHQTCGSEPCAVLNGGCAELCVADGGRHARCACGPGRRLAGDGRHCEPLARGDCGPGRYACAEGGCIPERLVCDNVPHCSDDPHTASDENIYYCTSRVCPEGYLRCGAGGRCVGAAGRCDGRVDCDDGSDERGCQCGPGEVRCEDGACVGAGARCDGRVDCAGASDERGCPHASCAALGPTAVPCAAAAGGCYLPAWRCDGARDCLGGEDEADCPAVAARSPPPPASAAELACGPAEFSCGGAPLECVPLAWVCDGRVDCATGADEAVGCGHGAGACGAGRWRCGARPVCVPAGARCDGRPDCPGAEDEAGCCEPPAIPCGDTCLAPELYCDGDRDCEDGSDEPAGCGRNVTSAPAAAPAPGPGPCGGGGAVACSGRCVAGALVCDGRDHCGDGAGGGAGTDEDPLVCSSFASAVRGAGGRADTSRASCAPGEWRCGNDACVPRDKLCDGHDDCGDYTDEWSCNVDECTTQNGGCAHNCTELRVGRACWCRPGWRRVEVGPGAVGRDSCRDVDECVEDAPCEHECRNTQGSYACSCHAGFALMPDGVSCAPGEVPATRAALLLTNRYYIRRVPLETGGTSTLLAHNLTNAVALDYSWHDTCVYWSDVTRGGSALRRACPAGAAAHTLHAATTQNPDGLAVDWVAGNLYWGDKGTDTIEASRLDGRHRRVLVRSGLSEPRALALLPARGWLYWSDWGARPHIGRAGMDGSGPHVRLARGLGWPNALTIAGGRLYFADAREDYIAEADLELREARVLLARSALPALRLHHAFAVAAWEGRLYWSDWETRAVESCRRTPLPHYTTSEPGADNGTTAAYECRTLLHTVHKPMDLRVFHPARQPPHPELTSSCERLQCEGLCLLAPGAEGQGARARCECPEHWVLQPDGRSCRHNCTAAHFVCRAALKCIPFWWRCDTADDCGDGADEAGACPPFRCRPGQFQCEDGRCLHPARVCDGTAHCARGEDERACAEFSCLAGQFTCEAGSGPRCVPAAARCDGARDCAGGEDEAGCTCGAGQVACAAGGCVPGVWACDADRDCADGSDEGPHCNATVCSQQDEFRCHTGRCIPTDWRCDGDPDCPGREDEAGCEGVAGGGGACSPTYFRCPDGRCIPGRWRCDLEDDCGDGADEMQCSARPCSESEWRCEGGDCVPAAGRCDGDPHCADGSDEACASCAPGARRCATLERCVRAEWWCDGEPDCPDGSDEAACGAGGAGGEPPCAGGLPCGAGGACLPAAWRCDGRRDCPDGRDEAECERVSCPGRTHRCGDATCLPAHLACDGARDCADGSDEDPALCTRRSALGEEVCAPEEHLCPDGSCQLAHLECGSDYDRVCPHTACSQLCLPKHDNYTCKCVPGFKQRVLPDGMQTCEAPGERPQLLVAEGGVVRVWDLRKQEAAPGVGGAGGGGAGGGGRVVVAALTGAVVDGEWWAWWGDEAGGLWRRRVGGEGPAELLAREGSAVRGVAVDVVSSRLYWTVAGTGAPAGRGGRVRVGTLAARRAVTLYARGGAEPDDLVYCNETRRLLWTDRGVAPALWTMGADGRGPSRLLWRRLRRPAALALHAPARRVYLAEAGGEVVTVRAAGGGRGALPSPRRPCTRLAVWEEWVWCAMGRGVVRLPRRGAAVGPRRPLTTQGAVTALALLHPLGAGGAAGAADPCGGGACDASALCVRSASARGYSCLCPDGLEPADHSTDSNRTCVISRLLVAPAPRDHPPTRQDNGTPQEPDVTTAPAPPRTTPPHTHDHEPHHEAEEVEQQQQGSECGCVAGRGRCVRVAGGGHDVCACSGAWGGARCDLYVGHDHDCHARCLPPAFCAWAHRPDGGTALSAVYCACPLGATCITPTAPPRADTSPGASAEPGGGAWATTLPVLLAIAAALLALLYLLYRRTRSTHGRFGHARLADNVEITNPMYLAGEDEDPPPPALHLPPALHHTKRVGGSMGVGGVGNHFANPVYDTMYSQVHDAPIEEHANLLSREGGGSPPAPPERAALL